MANNTNPARGMRDFLPDQIRKRNYVIGIGAIVLDGARIGWDSLVAAGSIVTPNTQIPPRSFVMGSPAKVKRELSDEEILDLEKILEKLYKVKRDL